MSVSRCAAQAIVTMLAAVCAFASSAESAPRYRHSGGGSVTAESRYGNPAYTAPVRRGRFGAEVDLGHNTWVHCAAGDCRDTLRREKVDFWETKREEGGGAGRH